MALKRVLRVAGILAAIFTAFLAILMGYVYAAAWWTGESPAFFWP